MKPTLTQIVWKGITKVEANEELVDKVLQKCFEVEHINPTSFYICVTLTNKKNIQEINKQYRNINHPTDVLSFPMFEKEELDNLITKNMLKPVVNPLEGFAVQDVLGDIIIAIEKVKEQAKEYGNIFERELAYILVHGFYHLRGYDHIVEEEKNEMRKKEEYVLAQLNITRED